MAWAELIVAFLVFFAAHSLPVRRPLKPYLVSRLGPAGFTAAYSALSILILIWLIVAAGRAPFISLWSWAPWQSQVTLVSMLISCLVIALSVGRPNPFSFGGLSNEDFDPERAGIVRFIRHPLLVALAIWAIAHLLPNGDLAHVLLFGSFAIFAILGGRIVDRRKRREMGNEWTRLVTRLKQQPVVQLRGSLGPMVIRAVAGIVLFIVLIWLHPMIIGVSPVP